MYCPKCGGFNPDGSQFCASCGAPLRTDSPAGGFSDSHGGGRPRSAKREPAGLRILRSLASSPLFLTAVIAYTASVGLSIISAALVSSSSLGLLSDVLRRMDIEGSYEIQSALSQYQAMMGSAGFVSALITSIPSILTAVALWLIFANLKKGPGSQVSTTGFTILDVLTIISFVLSILGVAAFLLLGIVGVGVISELSDGEGIGAGILVIAVVCAFMVLPLIFLAKVHRILDTARKMAAGGPVKQPGSIYVGVWIMLSVLISLWGLVVSPGIGKLANIAAGIASVCFSLLVFSFRERCASPSHAGGEPAYEDIPHYDDHGDPGAGNWYEEKSPVSGEPSGYNPADWTGYEPEAVRPNVFDGRADDVYGVPDQYDTNLEFDRGFSGSQPDPNATMIEPEGGFFPDGADPYGTVVDPGQRFFQGDPEDTIVESMMGGFGRDPYKGNNSSEPENSNGIQNPTFMTYPEQAPQGEPEQKQGHLFSEARDLGGQVSEDPFGNREKPVFSVQEPQDPAGREPFAQKEASGNRGQLKMGSGFSADPAALDVRESGEPNQAWIPIEDAWPNHEQERLAKEREEQERQRLEQERLAKEREEQERQRREQERLAKEREEQERQRREQERVAKERAMQNASAQPRAPRPMPIYETTTLSTSPLRQRAAVLMRHRDQTRVSIKNPVLRIGRNVSEVDYWVQGNRAIGRHHADIIFREGDYYIIDRNSTNHVYVDGKMIEPGKEVPLPEQAVIRLADEDFTFRVNEF